MMYDEKVVVIFRKEFDRKQEEIKKEEIWCAEIKVERYEEGEIYGRVEWCGCVFKGMVALHKQLSSC